MNLGGNVGKGILPTVWIIVTWWLKRILVEMLIQSLARIFIIWKESRWKLSVKKFSKYYQSKINLSPMVSVCDYSHLFLKTIFEEEWFFTLKTDNFLHCQFIGSGTQSHAFVLFFHRIRNFYSTASKMTSLFNMQFIFFVLWPFLLESIRHSSVGRYNDIWSNVPLP